MIRLGTLFLGLLTATQATALTCVRPDPLQSFRDAQAAPGSYAVLYGALEFDPAQMPENGLRPDSEPRPNQVGAAFSGLALGREGFTRPVQDTVTLQPICAGPWCGAIVPGTYLIFAEITDSGYRVEIGPCGGGTFGQVPEETLTQLAACMRGQACGG